MQRDIGATALRWARTRWGTAALVLAGLWLLLWGLRAPTLPDPASAERVRTSGEQRRDTDTSLEDRMRKDMIRLASDLKRDRRADLKRQLETRRVALETLKAEVEQLEGQIDPAKDENQLEKLLLDQPKPVDLQQYSVIPRLIHLTWKTKKLPYYGNQNLQRWKELNPKHTIVLYDDDEIAQFVAQHFPEFQPYWGQLKPVQKADVFRYVVMWKLGGVYADIDVEPVQPITGWIINSSATVEWRTVNVVLGWEQTTERKDWAEFYASQLQICQWAFASTAGHKLWRAVMDALLLHYQSGSPEQSIIRSTGPGMFSDAVKTFLQQHYQVRFMEGPLTIKAMKKKPLHAGDVLLLTTKAFAEDSWSFGDEDTQILARHSFAGSWKTKEPSQDGEEGKAEKLDKLDTLSGKMQKEMAKLQDKYRQAQQELKELRGKKDGDEEGPKREREREGGDAAASDEPWWLRKRDAHAKKADPWWVKRSVAAAKGGSRRKAKGDDDGPRWWDSNKLRDGADKRADSSSDYRALKSDWMKKLGLSSNSWEADGERAERKRRARRARNLPGGGDQDGQLERPDERRDGLNEPNSGGQQHQRDGKDEPDNGADGNKDRVEVDGRVRSKRRDDGSADAKLSEHSLRLLQGEQAAVPVADERAKAADVVEAPTLPATQMQQQQQREEGEQQGSRKVAADKQP